MSIIRSIAILWFLEKTICICACCERLLTDLCHSILIVYIKISINNILHFGRNYLYDYILSFSHHQKYINTLRNNKKKGSSNITHTFFVIHLKNLHLRRLIIYSQRSKYQSILLSKPNGYIILF